METIQFKWFNTETNEPNPYWFFTEEECIGDYIRIFGEESMGLLRLDTRTIDTPTTSDILYMSFMYLLRSDLYDISGLNENIFNPFTWEEIVEYFTQEALENLSTDRVINLSSKFVLRAKMDLTTPDNFMKPAFQEIRECMLSNECIPDDYEILMSQLLSQGV